MRCQTRGNSPRRSALNWQRPCPRKRQTQEPHFFSHAFPAAPNFHFGHDEFETSMPPRHRLEKYSRQAVRRARWQTRLEALVRWLHKCFPDRLILGYRLAMRYV